MAKRAAKTPMLTFSLRLNPLLLLSWPCTDPVISLGTMDAVEDVSIASFAVPDALEIGVMASVMAVELELS